MQTDIKRKTNRTTSNKKEAIQSDKKKASPKAKPRTTKPSSETDKSDAISLFSILTFLITWSRDSIYDINSAINKLQPLVTTDKRVGNHVAVNKVGEMAVRAAIIAVGGDISKVDLSKFYEPQEYCQFILERLQSSSFKLTVSKIIRFCQIEGSLESAMAASWYAYYSPVGEAALFTNYMPVITENLNAFRTGKMLPDVVDGGKVDNLALKKWMRKAPNMSSSLEYFHSKFLYYVKGFKVRFNELD